MHSTAGLRDTPFQTNALNATTAQGASAPASLIDPVPGHPDADVKALLREYAKTPGMQDAVKAVFQLIDGEPVPTTINDASCQTAAFVLLELGQGQLLCSLAQDRPLDYQLNIGAPHQKASMLTVEQKAQVLAKLSPTWPQSTPVSLTLCISLSSETVKTLHPFLLRPTTVNVHVVLEDVPDELPVAEFAAALCLRGLSTLVIECNSPTRAGLRALCGVQAQAVTIQVAELFKTVPLVWFEIEVAALVGQSGATKLNVAHEAMSATLTARFLGCRDHWKSTDLHVGAYTDLMTKKGIGKVKVDQLNVHSTWEMPLQLTKRDLQGLVTMGVTRFIFHGAMDLMALGRALRAPLSTLGGYVSHIEATCVLPDGASFEKALARISDFRDATAVVHRPDAAPVEYHRLLTDDEAARLAALRRSNSSMAQAVGGDHSQQNASELAWWNAIHALGPLLLPHMRVVDVNDYLQSPDNKALPAMPAQASASIPSESFSVRDKLKVLTAWGATDALIRKVLGETLRAAFATDTVETVFQALLDLRFPLLPREKTEDWYALGRSVETRWASDGMSSNATTLLAVNGPTRPENAAPGSRTTTTTSTTATTTTTSTTAIETDADPQIFSFVSVVHPSTEASLAQLIRTMKDKISTAGHGDYYNKTYVAAKAIVSLLEGHGLDMTELLEQGDGDEFTKLLLEAGEWRLLRHIVPMQPNWHIDASTEEIASQLAAMAPWPSPTNSLHLTLPSTLSVPGIQSVATLASATPREHLALSIEAHVNAETVGWNALADMVNACPCASLRILQDFQAPASFHSLGEFLGKLMPTTVGELVLLQLDVHESENEEALAVDLVTVVQRSGITALRIVSDSDRLVKAMATSHPWSRLAFKTSRSLAADLKNQTLVTQSLSLDIAYCRDQQEILHIVNACKGLKTLDLWGAHVDIEILAAILHRAPSITTLQCEISADTPSSATSTLDLLSGNTTLQRYLPPSRPANKELATARALRIPILELTVRNQFLHAQRGDTGIPEFAIGAVSGLAQSGQLGLPDDLSLILSGMLDDASAKSLSFINKASYLGSRQDREKKILALAEDLASHAAASVLAGSAPGAQKFLVEHVQALRESGTPEFIIREALGRRLRQLIPRTDAEPQANANPGPARQPTQDELDTVPHLLEALAYVGAIPLRVWLKDGLGIDPGAQ